MADTTLLFDELLHTAHLRSKSYVVREDLAAGMACVELSARRADNWFFARRWVGLRQGRRFLFWLLDEIETLGFRFQIQQVPSVVPVQTPSSPEPWALASVNWASLTEEERQIHRELFPQEEALLRAGYDWDHHAVYRSGQALVKDRFGRWMEETDGVLYEWVRIPDEYTWRRYPLYVVPSVAKPLVADRPQAPESTA